MIQLLLILAVTLLSLATRDAAAQTPPTTCANQPAGLTVIRDTPFSTIPGDGWAYNYPDFNLGAGVVADNSAPKSPSNVSSQRFPSGLVGGNGGGYGSVGTDLGGAYEVTYYCIVLKTDADFEQHPVFTKLGWFHVPTNSIFFALSGNTLFQIALNWQWPTGDADNTHLGFSGSGFLNGTQFFGRNQWVQLEVAYKPSTTRTSRDGYYCSWLNGVLSACTNQLNTPDSYPAGRMQTRSTSNITIWGGTGSTKTRDSYIYFDHWRIAVGNSLSGGTTPTDTTPPGQVTSVTVTQLN